MKGAEHYKQAENWAEIGRQNYANGDNDGGDQCLRLAQVHATLALTAATAWPSERDGQWPTTAFGGTS